MHHSRSKEEAESDNNTSKSRTELKQSLKITDAKSDSL